MDGTKLVNIPKGNEQTIKEIIYSVYESLKEKGYNPISQLVGYIISGDPSYITSHDNARTLMKSIDRDDLLEELLKYYLNK